MLSKIIRYTLAVILVSVSFVNAAETPTVSETDKLKVVLLVRELELAQLKAQVAQQKVVEQIRLLDAAAPGYHFVLESLSYQPNDPPKEGQ